MPDFSNASIRAWLVTKGDETFASGDGQNCALAQYMRATGIAFHSAGYRTVMLTPDAVEDANNAFGEAILEAPSVKEDFLYITKRFSDVLTKFDELVAAEAAL